MGGLVSPRGYYGYPKTGGFSDRTHNAWGKGYEIEGTLRKDC